MCPRSEKNVSTINAIIVRQCETHSVIHLYILTLTVVSSVNVINCDNSSSRQCDPRYTDDPPMVQICDIGLFGHLMGGEFNIHM